MSAFFSSFLPIGQGNLRHRLTNALRESGGHIGYAIAKPYRGKGCGKELLRLLIAQARAMGITETLLVTVRLNNIPSRRTAEACGYESEEEIQAIRQFLFEVCLIKL